MQKKKNKTILFVTGTRADYGKLLLLANECYENGHKIIFFVTGMHMMHKYGLTKEEVRNNKYFEIFEFINQRDGDLLEVVLSKTINGFSDYIQELSPKKNF